MRVVKLTDRDAEVAVRQLATAWALAATRALVPDDAHPHWVGDSRMAICKSKRQEQEALAQSLKCTLCAFGVKVPEVNAASFLTSRVNGGFFYNPTRGTEERERLVADILYQFRKFGVTEMAPELTDEQKAHMKYMSDTWPG